MPLSPFGIVILFEHVQISVTKDIGVEDRGGYYYDGSGALRDMVP
jgi:glucose-6-phosphate 1-dehydrogenase